MKLFFLGMGLLLISEFLAAFAIQYAIDDPGSAKAKVSLVLFIAVLCRGTIWATIGFFLF